MGNHGKIGHALLHTQYVGWEFYNTEGPHKFAKPSTSIIEKTGPTW
jgi:hypothetical protein